MRPGNKIILLFLFILMNNFSIADDKISSTPLINLDKIKPSFESPDDVKDNVSSNQNIRENTTSSRAQTSGLNYGSHNLDSLVKTQCPKTNKYSHNASTRIHRNKLS